MQAPISIRIECAKGEILNAMSKIQSEQQLPASIMDGVLSAVLAEVRSEAKIELINSTNALMQEKNEEIERMTEELNAAKQAAKKVLKTEPEEVEKPEE